MCKIILCCKIWLILMVCQTYKGYSMPSGWEIVSIVRSHSHLFRRFLRGFFLRFYRIRIFFKPVYFSMMGLKQVLPLQVRVDMRVMTMKGYFINLKFPKLKGLYQIQFSFGLVSLFNGISIFEGYLMPKLPLVV